MSRFFWLKSDGKTVEQITFEQYQQLCNSNFHNVNKHQLLVVHQNGDLYCLHGRKGVYFHGCQLEEVLKMAKEGDC